MGADWRWDEMLFAGSAPYYQRGRLPYAPELAAWLARALALDGHGRLLDLGCGPGTLTLPLASLFAGVVGVDPDPDMLAEAARQAACAGVANVRWLRARAEDLPAGLGRFRVATFGQSLHWMNRERVVAAVLGMLEPRGFLAVVSHANDEPAAHAGERPAPPPPYDAIAALVRGTLGPVRRAGRGFLPDGTASGEEVILEAGGFAPYARTRLPGGAPLRRSEDDLVAWVYAQSSSAPHLFGKSIARFETELRAVLRVASPSGIFAEQPPATVTRVWRAPD